MKYKPLQMIKVFEMRHFTDQNIRRHHPGSLRVFNIRNKERSLQD